MPGVAGTSCASPTAAGVIALLNDARLAAGKSTLGFMNPWLYSRSSEARSCPSRKRARELELTETLRTCARARRCAPPPHHYHAWNKENRAAWNDITTGSSSGGACESGWPAVEGWDAVTGLGTPNYANLKKVL